MDLLTLKKEFFSHFNISKYLSDAEQSAKDYLLNEEFMADFLSELPPSISLNDLEVRYKDVMVWFSGECATARIRHLIGVKNNGQDYFFYDLDISDNGEIIDDYFDCYL